MLTVSCTVLQYCVKVLYLKYDSEPVTELICMVIAIPQGACITLFTHGVLQTDRNKHQKLTKSIIIITVYLYEYEANSQDVVNT